MCLCLAHYLFLTSRSSFHLRGEAGKSPYKWWCLKLTQAILLESVKRECEMLEPCVCVWLIIYFSLVSPPSLSCPCICD